MSTNKGRLGEIFNEQEETYVQQFADNAPMREAVKKALLSGAYEDGRLMKGRPHNPLYNVAFRLASRGGKAEDVGNDVFVLWECVNIIEGIFEQIIKYYQSVPKGEENKPNEAR